MTELRSCAKKICGLLLLAGALVCSLAASASAAEGNTTDLLTRTSQEVAAFLEQFSDVKCTERVTQEKLKPDGKVELKEESAYDYLIILTNAGGELNLDESRLAIQPAKQEKKNTPMLVTNGFATLFLIFHPDYAGSFQFSSLGEETLNGRLLRKIGYRHIRGTQSPAALALRGREFPLELSGTAWIDPQSGAIAKLTAGIGDSLVDLGLKTLNSEIEYSPISFRGVKETYWFPAQAEVEVETAHQHWRNIHVFSDYKRFSVSTEEQVANK
jgi:hypothetical protein